MLVDGTNVSHLRRRLPSSSHPLSPPHHICFSFFFSHRELSSSSPSILHVLFLRFPPRLAVDPGSPQGGLACSFFSFSHMSQDISFSQLARTSGIWLVRRNFETFKRLFLRLQQPALALSLLSVRISELAGWTKPNPRNLEDVKSWGFFFASFWMFLPNRKYFSNNTLTKHTVTFSKV